MTRKKQNAENNDAAVLDAASQSQRTAPTEKPKKRPLKKTLSDRPSALPKPAKNPEDADGEALVFELCQAVELGRALRSALLEELADRLRQTLGPDGVRADEALRFRKKTGGRPQKTAEEQAIVADVEMLRAGWWSIPTAQEAVSTLYSKSPERIREIWEAWAPEARAQLGARMEAAERGLRKTRGGR